MKKDIIQRKVENLAIAIVPRIEDGVTEEMWDTYIINLKEEAISNVLISSKGYGAIDGEKLETTTLRHFFDEIKGNSVQQIEPIQSKLFSLTNEYWVSFTHNEYMYDKNYIFVKGSISEEHFTMIPFVNKKGVMIK